MSAVLKHVTTQPTVSELVAHWVDYKRAEDLAAKRRVEIESQIIAALGEPDEGSETHELPDGSKLTIIAKVSRTIDEAAWRQIMAEVPEALRPITFAEVARLDLKGLRWLMDHEPRVYNRVAAAITSKTAISLKVA